MKLTANLFTAVVTFCFAGLAQAPAYGQPSGIDKIEPALLAQAEQDGNASYLVHFDARADLKRAFAMTDSDARGRFVYDALKQVATSSQARVLEYLRLQRLAGHVTLVKPFLSVNAIGVTSNDASLVGLAAFDEILRIESARPVAVPRPIPGTQEAKINGIEWGVARVGAPEVWANGFRGEGIVVANIDTGVQFDHPALVGQYRGNLGAGSFDHNYNWWDPNNNCGTPSSAPCDNSDHGSHTMGTMIGDDGGANQIGVAPGAEWMACKGCGALFCSSFSLLECADFILAPWDLSGANPDPTKRPHVVNNSWGGGGGDPWYKAAVDSWIAAGIFPAFSNGNSGSGCSTSGSPGDYQQSFSSGAIDINGNIASFSSRGPSVFGGVSKPDIAAPGVNVRSSVPPNSYANFNGTSMASPHTAGMVALLWSQYPNLVRDVVGTVNKLRPAAEITNTAQGCGGDGPTDHPNNVFGWGIADAFAAHSPFNIYADRSVYGAGDTASLQMSLVSPFASTTNVDLYVALRHPSGQLLFYPSFEPVQAPWLADFSLTPTTAIFDSELLNELIDTEPGGFYNWFAAMVPPGGDPTDPSARLSFDSAPTSLNK